MERDRLSSSTCFQRLSNLSLTGGDNKMPLPATGPSIRNADPAHHALHYAARYDSMRLETYRHKEDLGDRIGISHIGSALALRFDDVEYFNRVYCTDFSFQENLSEIEDFYRGGPFGFELVGPPSVASAARIISRSGSSPGKHYAWLGHPDCGSLSVPQTTQFDIRSPEPSERLEFLLAYLRAFEAQEDRIPSALRNMQHLFDRPELTFLMAREGEHLAGIAMSMRCDNRALLCAGAVLPEFRSMGCHAALLAARIRLAAEAGCAEIYSWTSAGSQSQANMEKAGLVVLGTTTSWRFSPE